MPSSPTLNTFADVEAKAVQSGIFNHPLDSGTLQPLGSSGDPKRGSIVDRWSLSTWLLYRPENGGASLANAGQLGASQAGARIAYDLTPLDNHSLAVHARVTSALQSPESEEAALGMTWRPARTLPLAFAVERRIALGQGGRDAFAAYAAGGIGPTPLVAGFQVEGYAQAGMVGLSRTDLFADGRIALGHVLPGTGGTNAIMAGFALSGGAQPSLSRLDIGPQLSARVPLGGSYARVALEWRERIAGSARPGSGPALVLAADF
ncbi:bacteriophage N4 adsorption protein A [Rhizorhapis sp. SPR117]|uniref:bacteriophage N4 adsorption protein A n=1 Tax=Rhizorhapis sp. SPR117 TaxID=2912611 RepID=UPI001F3E408E|nr:bacteriophage N4 adsorption protein A [Rhizorhapis sp. SPR117]